MAHHDRRLRAVALDDVAEGEEEEEHDGENDDEGLPPGEEGDAGAVQQTHPRRRRPRLQAIAPHAAHLQIRLRKGTGGADDGPWTTELVCFFFNAQGDVLEIYRGASVRDGTTTTPPGGVRVRRNGAKEAVEKESMVVALADVHPSVEVIGFLVTYSTEEIARNPRLNDFFVSCDTCADPDDDEQRFGTIQATRMFDYTHEHPADRGAPKESGLAANYAVICKVYRNADTRNVWMFHAIGERGLVRSSVNAALVQAMQVFLLDIIPEIELASRKALNSVGAICAALSCDEFLGIEEYFKVDGVRREEFVKIILLSLMRSRRELRRLSRAAALVSLLFEMFDQIDINGDGAVDWEEFTTFCISLGLIATNEQQVGNSGIYGSTYQQRVVHPATRKFPYQVRRIRTFPSIRRIAVVENKSSIVLMYDNDMTLVHEMNHLQRLSKAHDNGIWILDVDHVPTRNLLLLSSSDHVITCWSIVNPTSGAYVFAFRIGTRCPIPQMKWCAVLGRLLTISADGVQVWDLDSKRVATKLYHHNDRMTDCIELNGLPYIATCSFDATIAILSIPTLDVAFKLEGHIQGVKQLDFMHNVLVSSGFEHQAYCWSIPNRNLLTTLDGHQTSLIGARFVSNRTNDFVAMIVTGDEVGHFRLWDVSRCLKGHSTDLAVNVQNFDVVTGNLCQFRSFACGVIANHVDSKRQKNTDKELVDIVTGTFRLHRFCPVRHSDDMAPPRFVTFNSISNTFVGCVDGTVTVWSASSGSKIEEPIIIRDVDVCGLAFDIPRQRKLFIATSDGAIRLYNPITAALLTNSTIHDGIISSLVFCPRSSCIISTGYDRRICVSYSSAGKTDIEVIRTVENAHDTCIVAAAYSHTLELVATGDDVGNIHVYDFQKLYLQFRCEGHTSEIKAIQFHFSAALLFSADGNGTVFIWYVASGGYSTRPIMKLSLKSTFRNEILPVCEQVQHDSAHGPITGGQMVSAIAIVPESKLGQSYLYLGVSNGLIWGWDLRVLTNHARKCGLGHCFEYEFKERDNVNHEGYNALLRVYHKSSVLKLQHEDGFIPSHTFQRNNCHGDEEHQTWQVVDGCAPSVVWQGHSDSIGLIRPLAHPGHIFSVSIDGSVKVWDSNLSCIGTISTHGEPTVAADMVSGSHPTGMVSSMWKFSQHANTEARDNHIRLANDILRRVKRKKKSKREQSNAATAVSTAESSSVIMPRSDSAAVASHLPPNLVAVEEYLAHQVPFSKESIRSGIQVGLFGAEEYRRLRAIGKQQRILSPQKTSLGALVITSKRPQRRPIDEDNQELPMMRTMQFYPLEIERRRVSHKRRLKDFDTTASPFLRDRLQGYDVAVSSPKSTPKTKVSLKMDANVIVFNDLALPSLQSDHSTLSREVSAHEIPSHGRGLTMHASAPCLPAIALDEINGNLDETVLARPNIQRKMKIYEGAEEMNESIIKSKEAKENDSESSATKHRGLGPRQQSQPLLSVHRQDIRRQSKRGSQGAIPTTMGNVVLNPFGPHYSIKQVMDFGAIIARFDHDFSGDIDEKEWVSMLKSFRPLFGASDLGAAEKLFHSIDQDDSGKISLQEILPMMFAKATPEQLVKMRQFIKQQIEAGSNKAKPVG